MIESPSSYYYIIEVLVAQRLLRLPLKQKIVPKSVINMYLHIQTDSNEFDKSETSFFKKMSQKSIDSKLEIIKNITI